MNTSQPRGIIPWKEAYGLVIINIIAVVANLLIRGRLMIIFMAKVSNVPYSIISFANAAFNTTISSYVVIIRTVATGEEIAMHHRCHLLFHLFHVFKRNFKLIDVSSFFLLEFVLV